MPIRSGLILMRDGEVRRAAIEGRAQARRLLALAAVTNSRRARGG